MTVASRILLVGLAAIILLQRLPAETPLVATLASALALVPVVIHLLPGRKTLAWMHYIAFAGLAGMLLVPRSSEGLARFLPDWVSGIALLFYVGLYVFPQDDSELGEDEGGSRQRLRSVTRWLPLAVLLAAAIALPPVVRRVLPRPIADSWELADAFGILAAAAWIAALALTVSFAIRRVQARSAAGKLPAAKDAAEPTA